MRKFKKISVLAAAKRLKAKYLKKHYKARLLKNT